MIEFCLGLLIGYLAGYGLIALLKKAFKGGMIDKCIWVLEKFDEYYNTECGRAFALTEGTPEDNTEIL